MGVPLPRLLVFDIWNHYIDYNYGYSMYRDRYHSEGGLGDPSSASPSTTSENFGSWGADKLSERTFGHPIPFRLLREPKYVRL